MDVDQREREGRRENEKEEGRPDRVTGTMSH